ncbi:hypothetical protein EYB45_05285 [Erythrobacteraceae bacterium CFH 75059]|uniref:Rossmann fold domain-containing protein n=1 Tax=Qipengyuania thermophila TaxID=2509361 RepID=UPI001022884B|nr:hypothetical protein [Qipengyuania thermophila]TCD04948.1 hypothetical protein EYB45_05285 [Erythrobacteraceae bacterium CFH 75059]
MQRVVNVTDLPTGALEAACAFHRAWVPQVMDTLRLAGSPLDSVLIVLPPAGHAHREWRAAAMRMLAREAAPIRVNGIALEDDADVLERCRRFFEQAPGVTGHYLPIEPARP